MSFHLKSTDDHQSVDVEFGNILADFLQQFTWKSSLGEKLHSEKL